jgi:serine protease AprX
VRTQREGIVTMPSHDGAAGRNLTWGVATVRRVVVAVAASGVAAALAWTPATGTTAGPRPALTGVIVQATDVATARHADAATGGRVRLDLPIVDGVSARIPDDRVAGLRAQPGVRAVTADAAVAVSDVTTTDGTASYSTPAVVRQEVGATALEAAGKIGQGAVVALVDTGVTPVPDLAGRLVTDLANPVRANGPTVSCIDFSGEGSCTDSYGHGTFMAGLIAGTGAQSGGVNRGVAPGARVLSIKIAGRDGSADVTKLLAAIQWAVSFRSTYGISVLNLSLGTASTAPYETDPLDFAVERAWSSGIAVVAAASNRGPTAGSISKPGDDPLVITAGAVDDHGTPATADDRSPDFTGRGPTAYYGLSKPDVVAPGAHVVSLNAPGSFIEQSAPAGGGFAGTPYRRGSGTSMATAVTSGVAALVWSARPDWRDARWPDRLKYALATTAHKVSLSDPYVVGAGSVDAYAASAPGVAGFANVGVTRLSDGSGALDAARGLSRVKQDCTTLFDALVGQTRQCVVTGQRTAQDRTYDSWHFVQGEWTAQSWYAGQWAGNSWEGNSWEGNSWEGNSWEGVSWEGYSDPNADYGRPVTGSAWYGAWD